MVLLIFTTCIILVNLIPALMYDRGHFPSDIYTSAILSVLYISFAILLHPG